MRHADIAAPIKGLSTDSLRHQVPPPVPKVERVRATA
ncbi:hypothetical protein HDG38_003549 [Paraburkholderia sp. WSM4177]|nr:hypothetical protein [Paraburkholderia sp. WSM4177]MBB5483852.1 hypothetical protein [Paraburkholderia sp. WSM4180]